MTLTRSTDRKTAAAATPNGKGVKVANAFGLPAGKNYSCPGATPICEKVCYAGRIEKQYKNFMAVMVSNWEQLQGKTTNEMFSMLAEMMQQFIAECERKNVPKFFRIHHDGDFFSMDYANAWARIAAAFPEITFWVYTRSFTDELNVIPALVDIPNLSVYISVDDFNFDVAFNVISDYPQIQVAMLTDTFDEGINAINVIRNTDKPGAKCPELTKQIPLISEKGGACFACGLCPKGKADIRFAIKKR
jgi:hypothetical protein